MSEIGHVTITIAEAKGGDPGRLAFGYYRLAEGVITMTDPRGNPGRPAITRASSPAASLRVKLQDISLALAQSRMFGAAPRLMRCICAVFNNLGFCPVISGEFADFPLSQRAAIPWRAASRPRLGLQKARHLNGIEFGKERLHVQIQLGTARARASITAQQRMLVNPARARSSRVNLTRCGGCRSISPSTS
jgi:hypothetical protein